MKEALNWLNENYSHLVQNLAELVAIPSISTDGRHAQEIDRSAEAVSRQMQQAGLQNVRILRFKDSYPYVYGEWCNAPGKPTAFLYSHHDVQPVAGFEKDWQSEPWTLTARGGRLYGRGSADDKAAIVAQLGSLEACLKTTGSLPINVKMLVEGEEEIGSKNLMGFFKEYRDLIRSDVIIVNDTENLETGLPSITYSLRGIVALEVEVEGLKRPVHSGAGGGLLPDAAIALNVILSRLYWDNGKLPIPGFYERVRRLTPSEKKAYSHLPLDEEKLRKDAAMLPGVSWASMKGVNPYEQTWRWPAVTVIAQEASSFQAVSNQVLPKARAVVSCRIVPDMDPKETEEQLTKVLTKDPPWGVKVTVKPRGPHVKWWMTDPQGPAFEAAMSALRSGYKRDPVAIGSGGTIGFVGPLADLLGGAPALLLGIEDPRSNAHAPNESLHEGDWKKLMASLVHLYHNLASLPNGRVK